MSSLKQIVRRLFRTPEDVDLRSQAAYLLWQKLLSFNRRAHWPVHFTSRVVAPEKVKLGRASYPGDMPGCYVQAMNGIEIGDYCLFGPNVGLISANHDPDNPRRHLPAQPIRLGNHCWIGMGAIVLPGVELGPRTSVGANAVVTCSFPEGNCVLAGNPAKIVRRLGVMNDVSEVAVSPGQSQSDARSNTQPGDASAMQG